MHPMALCCLLPRIIAGRLRDFLEQGLQRAATCAEVLEAVLRGLPAQDFTRDVDGQAQLRLTFLVVLFPSAHGG